MVVEKIAVAYHAVASDHNNLDPDGHSNCVAEVAASAEIVAYIVAVVHSHGLDSRSASADASDMVACMAVACMSVEASGKKNRPHLKPNSSLEEHEFFSVRSYRHDNNLRLIVIVAIVVAVTVVLMVLLAGRWSV